MDRLNALPKARPSKDVAASNSSSESDHKRRTDTNRRQQSPRTQRPFLRSFLRSNSGDNSDAKEDCGARGGSISPREGVFVRETRASRLRAASKTPPSESHSASPRPWKERSVASASPTPASSSRKEVDKSHSRKSHLNRSHTSEGVYHDIYGAGASNIRRRRPKTLAQDPSPLKTPDNPPPLPRPTMGNANGAPRDPHPTLHHLPPPKTSRTPSIHPSTSPTKPRPYKPSNPSPSPDRNKQIDIAARAQILAASTLKMINRLDEINNKTRRTDPPSVDSPKRLPLAPAPPKQDPKPSILKNKPFPASSSWDFHKPVSILKRKSLSQDDPQSSPPPVTFSPSVLTRETDIKRQGILKKRRSLDENEVLRRRSYSPDTADFKSILKSQRRSSLENLTTRSHSPDSAPQSILKRKSSKEEDTDEEPQGILKRKSLPTLHHLPTPEVPPAATGDDTTVRPILKKKTSSEDHSASDPSIGEAPKSILKKKASVEAEEPEERPKKPILKSSRVGSFEEGEEGRRRILKREGEGEIGSGGGGGEEGVGEGEGVMLRRLRGKVGAEGELEGRVVVKRKSLEFGGVSGEGVRGRKGGCVGGGEVGGVGVSVGDVEGEGEGVCGGGREMIEIRTNLATLLSPRSDVGRASPDSRTDEDTSSFVTLSPHRDSSLNSLNSTNFRSNSSADPSEDALRRPSSDDRYDTDCYYSLDSCGDKISALSLKDSDSVMDPEELFMLKKSGSVSAKTSLFKEMEKKLEEGKGGMNRRKEKKKTEGNLGRYRTQPVSSEEVEKAVRERRSKEEKVGEEAETHQDELCTMSYKDRLRLFESTLVPKFPEPRKRAERYRTQPITTDEVERAKSQKSSSAAATCLPSGTEESGSGLTGVTTSKPEDKLKPKGILKNILPATTEPIKRDSDSSDSDSAILKSETTEGASSKAGAELRGILKPSSGKTKGGNLGANLAALLQRVEPLGREKNVEAEEKKVGMKYLQNAGVARMVNRTRNSSLIVKSQSHSSVSSGFSVCGPELSRAVNGASEPQGKDEADDGRLVCGLRRSTTQPLGPSDESTDDDMSGASIQERLARLKRSGELDWQKRKSHISNVDDELSVITAGNYLLNEYSHLRDKQRPSLSTDEVKNSSSILADRLGKLDAAKEGWRKRIQPSDAVRFSVEGKMLEKKDSLSPPNPTLSSSPTRTPLPERKKRSPKAMRFRSKQSELSQRSVPSSPLEKVGNPMSRSVSAPGSGKGGLLGLSVHEDSKDEGLVVTVVPKIDDETFTSFFEGVSSERVLQERVEIKDEDLEAVTRMKSSQLLVQKRNIKTQKRRATVKNPLKTLAARLDLQEYTETKTATHDKELKRLRIEKAARNSNLAIEALAGLASREDFTAVSLRKPSEGGQHSPDAPYKPLMLLQVKGRRHVQTRLVEPTASSINTGDCYVLVTPNRVFHYVGELANVIERSRGAEICLQIQGTGDLGCTASSVVTIGEGGRATGEQVKEFWRLLGGEAGSEREAGNLDEDELFESAVVDTNMLYEVVQDELVPVEAYWGGIPKIEVLDPNKVLVFDFGSELYVWNGKNVSLQKRKTAMRVARELWDEGFDYSECDLCPLTASSYSWEDIPGSQKMGSERPPWALFAKITQNMETILFREKFLDWPDYTRVIRRSHRGSSSGSESNGSSDMKPCDAQAMLDNVVPEPDLVLEGSHLGRGLRHFDEETRRCSEISTKDVTVWHVKEFEYSEVDRESVGQFHMEDSYVVRWHYIITITGRELSGQPSKHLTTGRSRYAYFFWQGHDSPINDKGAAACITVELDKEHGPQVRVVQGLEPPAFLNLFSGGMVIHRGRRSDSSCDNPRLFLCRGEFDSEAALFEMPCSMRQLRSVASFLLVNNTTGKIIVWHGCKAPDSNRKIALNAAKRLRLETPEFHFTSTELTIREETEGSESQEFLKALGGDNRQLYHSLLQQDVQLVTPRLFHLSSVSGEFVFNELSGAHFSKDTVTPLPFLQSDLYSASQPALFLLDSSSGLWLWQGWSDDSAESDRGSGHVRFQAERRAAMSTALSYWNLRYGGKSPKAYLIWAGLEPLVFTNMFPFWRDRDDVAEINMKDGRKAGEVVAISVELASLTKSTYPLAQLLNRPLPDGVNPSSLEDYLEPRCFPDVFGMEKEEFVRLPSWKKKKLKQEVGLF